MRNISPFYIEFCFPSFLSYVPRAQIFPRTYITWSIRLPIYADILSILPSRTMWHFGILLRLCVEIFHTLINCIIL